MSRGSTYRKRSRNREDNDFLSLPFIGAELDGYLIYMGRREQVIESDNSILRIPHASYDGDQRPHIASWEQPTRTLSASTEVHGMYENVPDGRVSLTLTLIEAIAIYGGDGGQLEAVVITARGRRLCGSRPLHSPVGPDLFSLQTIAAIVSPTSTTSPLYLGAILPTNPPGHG